MLRAGVVALVLAALSRGAPISDDNKGLEERQWLIGDPWTTIVVGDGPEPTAIPTSGPGILPPITGGFNPPKEKRDDTGPYLGGSDPSALKAHITALELEYEGLVQQYGKNPPPLALGRETAIEEELKKYGITIVETPDGTSTTITPGKAKRQDTGPYLRGSDPSALKAHIAALELEYEVLVQQYGKDAPPSALGREKEIATELKEYGIIIGQTPDGTSTTITPGKAKRQGITIPGGDLTPDPTIPGGGLNPDPTTPLAQFEVQYDRSGMIAPPVFIIMQNMVTIIEAEGVVIAGWPVLGGGSTAIGPSD
ncbi:hypothetical protein BJ170DRAFT_677309 [Xylariales sp. AK1849]|nr:hypothetical protein BJ170DRAFT_677309 [Xylariales sp. AK1849]